MGFIKNVRISEVVGGLLDVALVLDIGAGIRCTTPYIRNTPEDNHIIFDFLGVSNWSQLKNKHIRVWIPGIGCTYSYEDVHMIGRERDNKWLDLKRREVVCCRVHYGFLYIVDEKRKGDKKMKDLNKVIARPYRMTEIRKRFDKLDLVEIDTYLDQGEYFLSKETDEDCRQYIFNTIAREIAEIAYIEPPEYTPEKAKHFRDTMNKHLLLALQYNEY